MGVTLGLLSKGVVSVCCSRFISVCLVTAAGQSSVHEDSVNTGRTNLLDCYTHLFLVWSDGTMTTGVQKVWTTLDAAHNVWKRWLTHQCPSAGVLTFSCMVAGCSECEQSSSELQWRIPNNSTLSLTFLLVWLVDKLTGPAVVSELPLFKGNYLSW